jgi:ribose transport system ATP-binding protein
MNAPLVQMKNINKKFQGVSALKDVSLEIAPNEIMCLLGENGAGKSTLIKILSGSILPDSGEILFDNKPVNIKSPRIATETGISVVHQELDLVPDLTVQQNLFLGRVETRFGIIKTKKLREQSMKAIERVGGKFSPDSIVSNLTVVERQLTMIARALTIKAKLLIMDEPSATLTAEELEQVFIVAKEVVKTGCSILYISHRMDEIFKIGDRATVLRDGKTVATHNIKSITPEILIEEMIGKARENVQSFRDSKEQFSGGLVVKKIYLKNLLHVENIEIPRGKITGFIGLGGSGRSTLLSAIFGSIKSEKEILLDDKGYDPLNPIHAIKNRVALVPEDRKSQGLFTGLNLWQNLIISLRSKKMKSLNPKKYTKPLEILNALSVKFRDLSQLGGELSGGNQQKIVLAKWLVNESDVLLLDEPTRGLDVGAKVDLFNEIHKLANSGAAIAVTSSELPEVLSNCDTIYVLYEGQIKAKFIAPNYNSEQILRYVITGGE